MFPGSILPNLTIWGYWPVSLSPSVQCFSNEVILACSLAESAPERGDRQSGSSQFHETCASKCQSLRLGNPSLYKRLNNRPLQTGNFGVPRVRSGKIRQEFFCVQYLVSTTLKTVECHAILFVPQGCAFSLRLIWQFYAENMSTQRHAENL